MGGAEVDLPQKEFKRPSPTTHDSHCALCEQPFREPFSGSCKHPTCKSCLVVLFTRNLPDTDKVNCPVCRSPLKLAELKRDQNAQRRLQKYKNCKCKNCNWRGSYTDYIAHHERKCGDIIRIQCKVLGCGKWLPKDKALELHRHDDWCPMILLMRTRLSHAEIVHLSMRESWDWTCGLVLRSDKKAVRDYIERLVLVFSALDPSVPTSIENDEYAATQPTDMDNVQSDSWMESSSENGGKDAEGGLKIIEGAGDVENAGCQGSGKTESDCGSFGSIGDGAAAASKSSDEFLPLSGAEFERVQFSQEKGKIASALDKELKTVMRQVQKLEIEMTNVKRQGEVTNKTTEELKNVPRAVGALTDRQTVLEGVMATFNKEVLAMNTRMDNFQVPSMLADTGILEKLVKANQDINRSITSLAQSLQKVDTRLLEVEASHTGIFVWKIANYSQKKQEAKTTNIKSIYSPPFFTSQYGYKLCGRVFLMGDGVGKGTHISLFLTIMKGPYDAILPWPFKEKITFQLISQNDPNNKSIVEAFRPDPSSSSFKRPTSEKNIGAGCPLFAKIQTIEDPKQGFVKDDTLYLKIISKTSDLPEIK